MARPTAIWIALAGTHLGAAAKAFMAWFGPKGVGTMVFSLLIVEHGVTGAPRIFNLAALTVLLSIGLHGVTDTLGPAWLAGRRARHPDPPGLVAESDPGVTRDARLPPS